MAHSVIYFASLYTFLDSRTFISVCNQPATLGQLSLPSLQGR